MTNSGHPLKYLLALLVVAASVFAGYYFGSHWSGGSLVSQGIFLNPSEVHALAGQFAGLDNGDLLLSINIFGKLEIRRVRVDAHTKIVAVKLPATPPVPGKTPVIVETPIALLSLKAGDSLLVESAANLVTAQQFLATRIQKNL